MAETLTVCSSVLNLLFYPSRLIKKITFIRHACFNILKLVCQSFVQGQKERLLRASPIRGHDGDGFLFALLDRPIRQSWSCLCFLVFWLQTAIAPFAFTCVSLWCFTKKSKRKVQGVPDHKPQPFPYPKRKRKPTNLNKHKPNKRTKSTKISSLVTKRGNRNTKRTEKHKNKMTHGKTYNKSPRRINHKATRSKTNTGTTALERSVEQTTGGFKALLQLAKSGSGPLCIPNIVCNLKPHQNKESDFTRVKLI